MKEINQSNYTSARFSLHILSSTPIPNSFDNILNSVLFSQLCFYPLFLTLYFQLIHALSKEHCNLILISDTQIFPNFSLRLMSIHFAFYFTFVQNYHEILDFCFKIFFYLPLHEQSLYFKHQLFYVVSYAPQLFDCCVCVCECVRKLLKIFETHFLFFLCYCC